jgi:Fic family protein
MDLDSDVTPGQYRTHDVAIKIKRPGKETQRVQVCMRARAVPECMKGMVDHLNQESGAAEMEGGEGVDPYVLAARFHYLFLSIHPLGDGSGRVGRIILNALLLRHAGCVSVFGATQGSRAFLHEDEEVDFGQQKGHLGLGDFLRAKSEGI